MSKFEKIILKQNEVETVMAAFRMQANQILVRFLPKRFLARNHMGCGSV